ncbi:MULTISPECIES: MFS transporter [Variovorax]|uniref:MFS transporter n=1 Tax=Variovorax ginsengisoli TaxID=363844 RepID=A0ABT8S2Q8_9BURK|nr:MULTISPECIES: MFS transporter [Variovorax]MDM0080998.1 MFS transporter [Variovorax sp. J31P179]MDN8614046.1 MFS transporter [Variovorax ginsengisoli]MDO1533216.1 MFS transporter [Variovorax ginsengisoli]
MPVALLALAAAAFAIGTSEFVVMGLLPDMALDLGVTLSQAGLLVTGYAMGVVVGAPVFAVATARLPRKATLVALACLFVLGNLLCALAPDYGLLMAARVITALAHGTFFGIGSVVAAGLVPPNRRSQAIALMFTGLTLANVLGVPMGRIIGEHFGWRMTFAAIVVIALGAVAALVALLPRQIEMQRGNILREFSVLADRRVLLALATSALTSASLFCVFTFIAPLLTQVSGFSNAAVAPVLLLLGVGLTIGSTIGGRLGDRRLVPSMLGVLGLNALVLGLLHFALPLKAPTVLLMLLWTTLSFALVPLLQTLIVQQASAAPNLASTLNQGAFNLGNAAGAWIGSGMLAAGAPLAGLPWAGAAISLGALALAAWSSRLGDREALLQTA